MNATEICYSDATELAALIAKKELSPVEVVQAHIDRIEAINPKVNAVVTLIKQDALKAAKSAEAAVLRGDKLGPFHGVPFSIKDVIDTAGVATKRGSKIFANHVPDFDAPVVSRLKEAGAIPLFKSNCPEFSAWWETDNLVTGCTRNPWNLDRTPGGSSGGESAAIAAGLSPMGLGSDVAISVRGPAAMTGIVGLKASHGRIPYTRHFPSSLRPYWHIGPMARSVRDVAAAFAVLNGPDGQDGFGVYGKEAQPAGGLRSGQPVRVGWLAATGFGPVDPEIVATVTAAAKFLRDSGCIVEPVDLPTLNDTDWYGPALTIYLGRLMPQLRPIMEGRDADLHVVGQGFKGAPDPSIADYVAAEARVEELKDTFAAYFQKYDVLLCPVLPIVAPPFAMQEYEIAGQKVPSSHVTRATVPFNLTGLPALSVPFRFHSQKLPMSVQLVSKWADEATILNLGLLIEAASEVHGKRPPL